MAISPPSDIVLDVARAVNPAELDAAREALARKVGAPVPAGADAAFALQLGGSPAAGATRQPDGPSKAEAYRKFEAMVLDTFVQNMLPQDAQSVYGGGLSGDMWKSMMSGKIAEVVAERGGVGIASSLLGEHYMDGDVRRAVGPVSRGPERSELDLQSSLSDALVQKLQQRAADALGPDRPQRTGASKGDAA